MDKGEKLDRLTDEIISVLVRAHKQAKLSGQSVVGTEFLLLVLLAEKTSFGAKAFKKTGIRLRDVRREIELIVPKRKKTISGGRRDSVYRTDEKCS
jgi:ATP-dependent Clp protease ATP-binding subunit ClpC